MNVVNGDGVNFTIMPDPTLEANCCNYQACQKCEGKGCCQLCGCAYSPMDFHVFANRYTREQRIRYLKRRIKRGDISFDHKRLADELFGAYEVKGDFKNRNNVTVSKKKLLEGKGALYLRARNNGKRICDIIHYNWEEDGPCVNWSKESGCRYKLFGTKPKGGRMLIPGKTPYECNPQYNELDAAMEWQPFQDILYEVFCYFWERGM